MTNNHSNSTQTEHPGKEQTFASAHSFYTYDIHGTDTDYKDQIQMHSLFSMMQEAASLDASVYGWGAEHLDKLDTCWLLLRMSVRMARRPSWLEKITVETWSRGTERLYFLRDFILYDESGMKIGVGSSVWILANRSTHRPVRPSALEEITRKAADPVSSMTSNPPKINPKADSAWMSANLTSKNTIVKFADFSEIDRNLHVNNTRYVAWCLDAAHNRSLNQGDILGIDIIYNAEIHFGEKVVLFFEEEDSQIKNGCEENSRCLHVDGYVAEGSKIAFSAVLYTQDTF